VTRRPAETFPILLTPSSRMTGQTSDEEIVARVRGGNLELFEILMRRYNQRLYRAVRGVLRDEAEAEDVVQEAWVRAFVHLGQFEGRARFSTWLVRIALHEAWARARRGRRLEPIPPGPEGDRTMTLEPRSPSRDPESQASTVELRRALERSIEELPETYRLVFVLRQVEDLSTAEAAECLELSEEAVKTRLHRARRLLRDSLAAKLGGESPNVLPFLGARCDGMVARVMARVEVLAAAR
jgi:RNA polymerase sigma-70 factor, ECF subfamily